MSNVRINEFEDGTGVNFLDYLPDDVVLNIVSKINDAKMLCNCTLVSKRFASFIFMIKSVSLRLPEIDADSFELYSDFLQVTHEVLYFNDDETFWPIDPSSARKIVKIIAFLRKFREVESIDIESPCPRSPCASPFLKWKGKLDSREPVVTGLVAINPTSMYKLADEEEPVEEEEEHMLSTIDTSQDDSLYALISCTEWLFLIFSVVKSHDSLRRVTCADTHRHGTFVIEAEQICEWRRQLIHYDEHPREYYPGELGSGWCNELHLPRTGYMLRRVSFMFMDIPVDGVFDDGFEDTNWEYGDDEAVLHEVVKAIINVSISCDI